MSVAEIEQRIATLERKVEQLVERHEPRPRRWWVDDAGRFKDDPVFDEIVRLGRQYRDSLRPKKRRKRK